MQQAARNYDTVKWVAGSPIDQVLDVGNRRGSRRLRQTPKRGAVIAAISKPAPVGLDLTYKINKRK